MTKLTSLSTFLQKVSIDSSTGCWLWGGYISPEGYGKMVVKKLEFTLAHRLSYYLHKGDFKRSLCVCHSCDNRRCVNPDHLFLGTNYDNIQDRNKKGRQARGSKHSRTKLSEKNVLEIRRMYKQKTRKQLSDKFKVSIQIIGDIHTRKTWRHI